MVESRSIVRGAPPGPAPADQARASNSRPTPIQLTDVAPPEAARERPQGGWRLDCAAESADGPAGAATHRRRRCSRRQPARRPPGSSSCRRCWPGPAHCPGRGASQPVEEGRDAGPARVAGRISPVLATRRWSSKATWMWSGWLSGSIYRVLLVWGRFCVSKTVTPEAWEHFLTPSAHRDTYLFGGLGFRMPLI